MVLVLSDAHAEDAGPLVDAIAALLERGLVQHAEVVIAFLTTYRDGKAIRVEEFLDPEEAMRALESTESDS